MITNSGKQLAGQILAMSKESERIAANYAIGYAKTDSASDKAGFERYSDKAETYMQIYKMVCAGIEQIETELTTVEKGT